jgi:DNA-binding winged helix-turn-helix (wHTH) protein
VIFAFGEHALDEGSLELRRDGRAVSLQPKALALLFYLVRHRDRVVPKQEILDAVWPDAIVTDGSLARAVSLVRLALGDRGSEPSVIVTVPRRGYRFHADVREVEEPQAPIEPTPSDGDARTGYVGRAELLVRLASIVDGALRGRGRILLLAGEAGIGKTRTAELLAVRARRAGAAVATAWGLEDGAVPTYWTWTRILRAVARSAGTALPALVAGQTVELARILPELADGRDAVASRASGTVPPVESESARVHLFEAVQTFLSRAAQRQPLALFLDDLHWADAESFWLLEFLGHAVGSLPMAVVATCREEDVERSRERARALARLLRLTSLERWPLSGLQGAEVYDFVRERLGREPAATLVDALARKTGGNPLFLGESLRSLEARGLLQDSRERRDWEDLLPGGIRHLVRHKLAGFSPVGIEVLACAAAIGAEVDRGLLQGSLERGVDVTAALREAEDAGLLSASTPAAPRLRFAHVLVRDALYAELVPTGDARRALHARVARALEARGAPSLEDLSERAHHACEAAPLVPPRSAGALARAAAERAASLHDFENAAAWYQRALDVLDLDADAEPDVRVALWLGLAAAHTRASGLARARVLYRSAAELARTIGRGDLFASAALGVAHRPNATGDGEPLVVELLEEAARRVPPEREALRIRVLSRLAGELRYAERPRAEALVEEAVAAAKRLGDPAVLAQALDDCSFVRWSPADPEGWIALNAEISRAAHESGDLELALLGHKGSLTGLLEIGDLAAVERESEACQRTASELRTPYARWLCAALRAMRALLDGRLDAAEAYVAESIPLGERAESIDVALELRAQLVYLRLEQGRAGEVEAAARAQVERFPDAPAWRAALARLLLSTGRLLEARQELERLAQQRFADVPRDRGWLPTLALAAEVAYATGATRRAELLEELLLPYERLCVVAGSGLLFYGAVAHPLGLLAASRGRWDTAIERLEGARGMHERAGARVWVTRSQVALARALLGRGGAGDARRAASLLAEALVLARALSLEEIATEIRTLDRRLKQRPARLPGRAPGE